MKLDVKRVVSLNHVSRLSHIYLSTLPSPCKPIISALILHHPSISLRPPPQSCQLLLAAFFFLHFTAQILHHVRGFDPRLSPCLARLSSPLHQTFTLSTQVAALRQPRDVLILWSLNWDDTKFLFNGLNKGGEWILKPRLESLVVPDTDGGGRSTQILHCYYYK